MILDDDILRGLKYHDEFCTQYYTRILESLVQEVQKSVETYKELLPEKAKREGVPHYLWIAPPTHKLFHESANEDRVRYTNCLMRVINSHKDMTLLKLVKHWNSEDEAIFVKKTYKFTTEGLLRYWMSVDSAIRFWNIALSKKLDKMRKKNDHNGPPNRDRYRWKKLKYGRTESSYRK